MTKEFHEEDSDFYDLEYYLSLEHRYLSNAHGGKVKLILRCLRELKQMTSYRRVLDVGCGGGFLTNLLCQEGFYACGFDYYTFA